MLCNYELWQKKKKKYHLFIFFVFLSLVSHSSFRSEYAGRPSKMFWGPQVDKPLLCFLIPIYLKNERKWSMIILKSSRPLKFPRRICYLFQTDRPTRPRPKGRRVVSVKDNWHIRFCPLFRNGRKQIYWRIRWTLGKTSLEMWWKTSMRNVVFPSRRESL